MPTAGEPPLIYPSRAELTFWWRCYRKMKFSSIAEATAVAGEEAETVAYCCDYCDFVHNGKLSAKPIPSGSMVRQQWRKSFYRPSLTELSEAFQNPSAHGRFFTSEEKVVAL